MSDEDYNDFKNWLSHQDVSYTTQVERNIEKLEKAAKDERYYQDIKEALASLKNAAEINKKDDLKRFSDEITYMLEEEIVSRYYFESGMIEAAFDDDQDILTAIDILNNADEYQRLLKAQ